MRTWVIWFCGTVLAVALGSGATWAVRQATPLIMAPRLVLSDEVIEFGQPASGQEESVYIRLENHGRGTLKVQKVDVSCGCITLAVENAEIPSGGTSRLKVTASGSRMSAGPRHEALIVTNDPVRPEIRVEIVVRAATTVGFEPGEIDFGRIDAKRLPAREVVTLRIENGLPPSQDNSTITSDLPFLKGEIISWDLNGKSISALVTLEPNAPTGEFVGRLTIALSGSEHEHSTGIVGCVLREYFAEPAAIVLGPIRTGSLDSSRTISLRARNTQQSFTILQVKGGDGWPMNGLSVSLSADDPRSILLTCNSYDLARPLGRGRFRTAIQISILSQDGAFTELNIPIELILAE